MSTLIHLSLPPLMPRVPEMFQVTTLDLENIPRTDAGKVDYTQDFFDTSAHLTVSVNFRLRTLPWPLAMYTFGPTFRAENSNTPSCGGVLDD